MFMKQRFILFVSTLVLSVLFGNSALAYDFQLDGIYYTIISESNKTVEVSRNKDNLYTGDLTIPSQVTKYGVTYTVTRIGDYCFLDCAKLQSVNIPETIDSICYYAFIGCSALYEINIDNKNTYFQSIDGVVFDKDLTTLLHFPSAKAETYEIPDGVKIIAKNSFTSNKLLRSLSMPSSVIKIEKSAFNCPNLIDIQLSESLEIIAEHSFSHCSFTSIILPESLKYIGRGAFMDCKLSAIFIPKNVEYISEDDAFSICSALEKIEVDPNNKYYTSIDGILYDKQISKVLRCPQNIKDMEWITLPSTITKICSCAFHEDKTLARIVIPSGVTIIDNGAFYYCSNLGRVVCYAKTPPSTPTEDYCSSDPWEYSGRNSATLYVPKGCADIYRNFYNTTYYYSRVYPYRQFKEIIEMDEETGFHLSVDNFDEEVTRYNTLGIKIKSPQKGINIIKMSNGIIKKTIK